MLKVSFERSVQEVVVCMTLYVRQSTSSGIKTDFVSNQTLAILTHEDCMQFAVN